MPDGLILRAVATVDVYVGEGTVQVMPLAASIGAAPRVTVAVMPEEHVVPVTEPFAQYVKLAEAVPAFAA